MIAECGDIAESADLSEASNCGTPDLPLHDHRRKAVLTLIGVLSAPEKHLAYGHLVGWQRLRLDFGRVHDDEYMAAGP